MSRASIKKCIDSLKEKGIISYKHTHDPKTGNRAMNEYKILRPKNYIKDFNFLKIEEIESVEKQEEDKLNWD